MARVTGGSFPAQTWKTYMTAAHDTDNIPQIPGVELHPRQVAEQTRIAAVMAQSTTADLPVPPPSENVKDMSAATRHVLEMISGLLKDAPRLNPNKKARPRPAAAAPAAAAQPNLASAMSTDESPRPRPTPAAIAAGGAASAEQTGSAPVPQ